MAQDKEYKLKKLIQSVEPDQPTADFTTILIQKIEAQEAIVVNPALDALLEKHLIEEPSIDFTQNLMKDIERLESKVVFKPIISKRVWYGIGMTATFIITLISLFGKSAQTNNKPLPLASNINQVTGEIIRQINALPALMLACLFAVSSLVLIDYFLSNRKKYQV
ncbi:hypothetical protein [Emticicia sp. C21]|uniref:hypothetical protein n=1 Tax=Emticicia sp. C21 TaxID=2302915 RepID=UPI000E3505DD|nr:hypothetical protein [Emticicia sp. C21]RFS16614.1 hypothetical protein D0T08_07975 [Emticicia sp. C21]